MGNSDRFLAKYNEIQRHLCNVLHLHEGASFREAIEKGRASIPPVRWRYDVLDRFRELRNTLVHTRGARYIAEPTDETVQMIEEVADLLIDPPTVDIFRTEVFRLRPGDPIADAVEVMFDRSYSQIPVYDMEGFVGLLTTNTVGRWLGACVEEEIFSLKETRIADVLHYTEDENNHGFLARRSTLFEALDAFGSYEQKGRRLEVSLLGIITIWDLPRIHEELAS